MESKIIEFQLMPDFNAPYRRSPPLVLNGYYVHCFSCKTKNCYRAGHNLIACAEHSVYGNPWDEKETEDTNP